MKLTRADWEKAKMLTDGESARFMLDDLWYLVRGMTVFAVDHFFYVRHGDFLEAELTEDPSDPQLMIAEDVRAHELVDIALANPMTRSMILAILERFDPAIMSKKR